MRSIDTQTWRVSRTRGVTGPTEGDIVDAYLYLLARLLVVRQEHIDFGIDGFRWNELLHRPTGSVACVNPSLDLAISEAWIAVDDNSYTLLEVPRIVGRYYTIQVLNLWGETIANLNERNHPAHPSGLFAFCLHDSPVSLADDVERIDLPSKKAHLVLRIELGAHGTEAASLQHHARLSASGTPVVAPAVKFPLFTDDHLPGVQAFESALSVMASEPDINPGIAPLQTKVRAVAAWSASNDDERARIDGVIRRQAFRALQRHLADTMASGNGWTRPQLAGNYGQDWLMRTVVNFTDLWANNQVEVIEFTTGRTTELNGSDMYSMTFAGDDLPAAHEKYFWSVTCLDTGTSHVCLNPKNRFVLDNQSKFTAAPDGSLTLYFGARLPDEVPDANWLPTPEGRPFQLIWRSYGPDQATMLGNWYPPRLHRLGADGTAREVAEFSVL